MLIIFAHTEPLIILLAHYARANQFTPQIGEGTGFNNVSSDWVGLGSKTLKLSRVLKTVETDYGSI